MLGPFIHMSSMRIAGLRLARGRNSSYGVLDPSLSVPEGPISIRAARCRKHRRLRGSHRACVTTD
jgi:hypothetical protein